LIIAQLPRSTEMSLADVRFGAHNGFKSNIATMPENMPIFDMWTTVAAG
jgi:hypothetical protein